MSDTLCPAVWDHLCVNTAGKNRLCCNAVTQDKDKFIGGFDQHWNGLRDNVKKEMLAGNRPEICKSCWKKEDAGLSSLRTQKIEMYKNQGLWDDFLNTISTTKSYPVELDLKLGNYCNLSCRMCSSYSSSGVANEFQKILKETGIDLGLDEHEKNFVQNKWYLQEEFVDSIKQMIVNGLRHLKFTGGEPLMVPSVKKLINYCVDNNYAKDIDLVIITNVTLIDDEWIERFKAFRFVNIVCSIDGVGDTFEYIRHPGNWNDVNDKLQKLCNAESAQFQTSITFTLQIYNILEVRNMVELSQKYNFHPNVIPLDKPAYLDVCNAPQALKNAALQMIESLEIELNPKTTPRTEHNCLCFHDLKPKDVPCATTCPIVVTNVISKFVSNIKKKILQPQQENVNSEFLKVTKIKDNYKKQDFSTMEISKYYDAI
jgi:MoaA/NifB/PqqE/SkfB family radical SAM enzyme